MLYVKLKNSCKIGKKTMQEWGIKGEVLTLDDPFTNNGRAASLSSKPAKKFKNSLLVPQ